MKILIADYYDSDRICLANILAKEFPFAHLSKAETGLQAQTMAREGSWDLLIMGVYLSDKSGLNVIKELRNEAVKIPILVVSTHQENQYAIRILRAEADGYISKDSSSTEFIHAVRMILRGKTYMPEDLAKIVSINASNADKLTTS